MHECLNEKRIQELETKEAVMSEKIENLIAKLGELTIWIRYLVFTAIPILFTAIGYLLIFWVKGK